MTDTVAGYFRFLWAGVVKRSQTGSLLPSQRFLITKMISPVPRGYRGEIIELGAGNGALTLRLAARCPNAKIIACEINPTLARDNRRKLDKAGVSNTVEVFEGPAEELLVLTSARNGGKPKFIISGIPLANLDADKTHALLDLISTALGEDGMYIQFQHSLVDRKKIKVRFDRLFVVPVVLNLPPAFVYYARRPSSARRAGSAARNHAVRA